MRSVAMKPASVVVFVALAAAVVGWLALQTPDVGRHPSAHASASAAASASAPIAVEDAGAADDGDRAVVNDAGGALLDGAAVPPLDHAPKSVRFGVVLVRYAGAEGAKPGTRTRAEATKLAGDLAELAERDFAAAVGKGDSGSAEDAGHMYRGILEPAPEYVLFSLEKGAVSAPVDTPRGYWIIKRLE